MKEKQRANEECPGVKSRTLEILDDLPLSSRSTQVISVLQEASAGLGGEDCKNSFHAL